jgi:archaea-specific RecJ-like exonuclease
MVFIEQINSSLFDLIKNTGELIRDYVEDEVPIIIRHHADTDGISGALIIEKACVNIIKERGARSDFLIFRKPLLTPYYNNEDMFRDISFIEKIVMKKKNIKPLLILIDCGCSDENIFSLSLVKSYGLDIIVIDHHPPVKDEDRCLVDDFVIKHINPHNFGLDHDITAGILSFEIASVMDNNLSSAFIYPALSVIGDKSNTDFSKKYVDASKIDKNKLVDMSRSIDFLSHNYRVDSASEVYNIFFNNKQFQEIIINHVNKLFDDSYNNIEKNYSILEKNNKVFVRIDLDKISEKGSYPSSGKLTGMCFSKVAEIYSDKNILVLGLINDMLIIRMNNNIFPLSDIENMLKNNDFNVKAGGHDVAGTIVFKNDNPDNIIELIKNKFFVL